MLRLFNSLTRKIEEFQPITPDKVGFYICGPTVYNNAHIGNLRTMIMGDLVRRVLEYNKFKVNQVMNITDVGHLTSDGDTGEDKMEKNAKNIEEYMAIAKKYTESFLNDLTALNIEQPTVMPKASEHVAEQIEMIKTLIEKGIAYESDEAVYFDVSKFPEYTKLVGQSLEDMKLGARQEVVKDPKKKNPYDFVLWFKTVGRYANHILRWDSPWGPGFPGWHIECSAMSKKYLGDTFDIHAAGIDLKFPHNTNEVAQSESANGKPFANYWLHGEHLLIDSGRMGKSEGNFITLQTLLDKGFNPLAFRYLVLTTHYRSKLNFTWESLQAAQNALNNLYEELSTFDEPKVGCTQFEQDFLEAVNDDLNTPKALAITQDLLKTEEFPTSAKLQTLLKFDQVLGLKIKEVWEAAKVIPETVRKLVDERESARKAKDFVRSDELRRAIESNGYILEDTVDGFRIKKKF
jgi:cysteinyl-tRNA synthetase